MGSEPVALERTMYWPSLDGMRALSIAAVILMHAQFRIGQGGDFGVTAFFVLSGFLITLILLSEHARTGEVSLRRFYRRRFLRLLPALLTMTSFVTLLVLAGVPVRIGGTLAGLPWSLAYVSNIVAAFWQTKMGAVGHTWSLAMEEQFYLVWPVLLCVLLRRRWGLRAVQRLLLVGAAASALWAAYYWHGHPTLVAAHRLYMGPDVEAQPLLIGCATAVLFVRMRAQFTEGALSLVRKLSPVCCVVLGFMALVRPSEAARYSGGLTVFSVCTAIVVLRLVLVPNGTLDGLLSSQPLVALGRISYGVYLWNYPVSLMVWRWTPNGNVLVEFVLEVTLSIGLAALSYRFVERPFLRRKDRLSPPPMSATTAASAEPVAVAAATPG